MLKEIEIIGLYNELDIKIPFEGKNSLSDGEVTILIGENGSGKTTILNILNILMNDIRKLTNIKFKKIILTIINKENIKENIIITSEFIDKIKIINNVLKIIDENLLDKFIEKNKEVLLRVTILNKILNSLFPSKIFLPTYRRIEKEPKDIKTQEIKDMFFGMDDINKLINDYMDKLKTSSSFALEDIKRLNKEGKDINDILKEIDDKNSVEINILNNFMNVCNKYLFNKQFIFIPERYEWYIEKKSQKRVTLKDLSSGEKQMISIFAQLYLKDDKDLIILFDEPELSISVAWQKMLIPDMLKSNKIKQLIVATHSPFIFDNDELFKNTIDIDDCTKESILE